MDWNRIEGNWKQFGGTVKEKWGKLTDDDLAVIDGKQEQLEGRLQQRYGYAKDQGSAEMVIVSRRKAPVRRGFLLTRLRAPCDCNTVLLNLTGRCLLVGLSGNALAIARCPIMLQAATGLGPRSERP